MNIRKSYTVKSGFKSTELLTIYHGLDEAKALDVFMWEVGLLKNFGSKNTAAVLYSTELEVSNPRTVQMREFDMSLWSLVEE